MLKGKWLKFLVVYLSAAALALSQLKISPIQMEMNLSLEKFGWLMSVFTLSALFLALPGGTMISKYGAKKVGIIVLACLVLGNMLGAASVNGAEVTNYTLLLISRIIEGVSFSMINMMAMVFIGEWFKEGSSGVAIGIFGTFSALASMFGYNFYLPVFTRFGLRSVWIVTAILAAIALLGFILLLDDAREEETKEEKSTYKEVFSQSNTWLLSIAMFTMTFVLYTFIAYYPRILTEIFGLSKEGANAQSGFFGLVGVPFGLVAGIIVDKFKVKAPYLGVVTGLLMTLGCFMIVFAPSSMAIVQVALLGAAISLFSSSISISVPRTVKRKELIGQTFAVVYLFYYLGVTTGAAVVAKIASASGSWKVASMVMGVAVLAGMLCMFLLGITDRKREKTNRF